MDKSEIPPDDIDFEGLNLHHYCSREADPAPGTSRHDFFSLSVYWWPNPETQDGLPYVARDGEVNPEAENYDSPNLTRMCAAVDTLALAYAFTDEERYAEKAAELLKVWFLDDATSMNPNMLFAQYVPGEGGFKSYYSMRCVGRRQGKKAFVSYGGVIEGSRFPSLLQSVELLRGSRSWTVAHHQGLQQWFHRFMKWLLESQHGDDESTALNNHASWYCNQIATYAAFCGDEKTLRTVLTRDLRVRIFLQIEPDGLQPAEMGRSISFAYVNFALYSFYNCALLGDKLGLDLWNYRTEDGRGLKVATEWLLSRIQNEKLITGANIHGISYINSVPLLRIAAEKYKDSSYAKQIDLLPGYPNNHLYRLLYHTEELS